MQITKKDSKVLGDVVIHLPIAQLGDHPEINNRALTTESIEEMKTSILASGLDEPLVLWDGGTPGKTVSVGGKEVPATYILSGSRRRAAIKLILKSDPKAYARLFPLGIPCRVRTGKLVDAVCANLRFNSARRDPDASEILPEIQRLRGPEFKLSQREIAKSLGKSDAWVSQILSVEKALGEEGVAEVKKGGISMRDAKKAASNVNKKTKAGLPVSAKEELQKAKASTASREASGRKKAPKRVSASRLYAVWKSLPRGLNVGEQKLILEGALTYLAGETEKLPKQLTMNMDKPAAAKKS